MAKQTREASGILYNRFQKKLDQNFQIASRNSINIM